jgi:hypothetical protein
VQNENLKRLKKNVRENGKEKLVNEKSGQKDIVSSVLDKYVTK